MFNRKLKARIRELENSLDICSKAARLNRDQWQNAEAQRARLEALLRDYDGRLLRAAQQPTPEKIIASLRELFLVAEARQREASDKLGQAIVEQMKSQMTLLPSSLERPR